MWPKVNQGHRQAHNSEENLRGQSPYLQSPDLQNSQPPALEKSGPKDPAPKGRLSTDMGSAAISAQPQREATGWLSALPQSDAKLRPVSR